MSYISRHSCNLACLIVLELPEKEKNKKKQFANEHGHTPVTLQMHRLMKDTLSLSLTCMIWTLS